MAFLRARPMKPGMIAQFRIIGDLAMTFSIASAPRDGREITIFADLAPFYDQPFFAPGHYDAKRGWVVKRELIGKSGFELLNVNARGWLP